jgi:hypothetical protein
VLVYEDLLLWVSGGKLTKKQGTVYRVQGTGCGPAGFEPLGGVVIAMGSLFTTGCAVDAAF